MARKKGLGKGLSALIPSLTEVEIPRERKAETKAHGIEETSEAAVTPKDGKVSKTTQTATAKEITRAAAAGKNGSMAKKAATTTFRALKKTTAKAEPKKGVKATEEEQVNPHSRKQEEHSGARNKPFSDGVMPAERFSGVVQLLSIEELETNPDQPRKFFAEDALDDLAASIRKYGILQPIVVKKHTVPGRAPYEIIAGERRFRAAQRAGLKEIPAVLREGERRETTMLSVIENVQREDLNPLEEATAYQQIMREQMLTQQQLAEALGKSRAYIANIVRLLKLDEESLDALYRGFLTSSQARALLSEPDLKKRARYRQLLVEGRTNVNAVEKRTVSVPKKDVFLQEMETRLSEHLGSRVSIRPKRKGWHFQVECYTQEDLNRLLGLLMEDDHE